METYTRSEVANILQMPQAKIKNWTIGRPLELVPSIRKARGSGSRNLYSRGDIYSFGLANELNKAGMNLELVEATILKIKSAIQEMKRKARDNTELVLGYDNSLTLIDHMVVNLNPVQLTITLTGSRIKPPGIVLKEKIRGGHFIIVSYEVPIGIIVSRIDAEILENNALDGAYE